jgi:hypothetical protein
VRSNLRHQLHLNRQVDTTRYNKPQAHGFQSDEVHSKSVGLLFRSTVLLGVPLEVEEGVVPLKTINHVLSVTHHDNGTYDMDGNSFGQN